MVKAVSGTSFEAISGHVSDEPRRQRGSMYEQRTDLGHPGDQDTEAQGVATLTFSTCARSESASSKLITSMSLSGSTEPETWTMSSFSKQRITCTSQAHGFGIRG